MKRVFLIVLDSFGIGEMEDAEAYGDKGTNTLRSVSSSSLFSMPNMKELGLFNIDGVTCREGVQRPQATVARMKEASKGKDTTIGHWEIAGVVSDAPLPTAAAYLSAGISGGDSDTVSGGNRKRGIVQQTLFGHGGHSRLWG